MSNVSPSVPSASLNPHSSRLRVRRRIRSQPHAHLHIRHPRLDERIAEVLPLRGRLRAPSDDPDRLDPFQRFGQLREQVSPAAHDVLLLARDVDDFFFKNLRVDVERRRLDRARRDGARRAGVRRAAAADGVRATAPAWTCALEACMRGVCAGAVRAGKIRASAFATIVDEWRARRARARRRRSTPTRACPRNFGVSRFDGS